MRITLMILMGLSALLLVACPSVPRCTGDCVPGSANSCSCSTWGECGMDSCRSGTAACTGNCVPGSDNTCSCTSWGACGMASCRSDGGTPGGTSSPTTLTGQERGQLDQGGIAYYQRVGDRNALMLVSMVALGEGDLDFDLAVTDGSRRWEARSTNRYEFLLIPMSAGRSYTFEVSNYSGPTAEFILSTRYVETTGSLSPGGASQGTIGYGGAVHCYQLTGPTCSAGIGLSGPADADLDLCVFSEAGDRLAVSRNSGSGEQASLSMVAGQRYWVVVFPYTDSDAGPYALACSADVAGGTARSELEPHTTTTDTLAVGERHAYDLQMAEGGWLLVDLLASDAADVDLAVSDGVREWRSASTASIEHVLCPVQAGQPLTIAVEHYSGEGVDYALSTDLVTVMRPLSAGGSVRGDVNYDGQRVDIYQFSCPTSGTYSWSLTIDSEIADLDLFLFGDDGLAQAKSRGTERLESIEASLIGGRQYYLAVVAYASGDASSFGLSCTSGAGSVPVPPPLATSSGNRGVFVGINDYQQINDLSVCVEDARQVRDLFVDSGQIASANAVLLTDGRATKQAIMDAIRQATRACGPEDTFYFFFSGHGGQAVHNERSGAADETDDLDEYLCTWETNSQDERGDLYDDELATLLDASTAGLNVVVMDACHCGGFREDLTAKGRFLVLSSQDDKVSLESGYGVSLLTYVFLNGARGRADMNRDGRIDVEEIEDYILRLMPTYCPRCSEPVGPADDSCGSCHVALWGEWRRQHPVTARLTRDDRPIIGSFESGGDSGCSGSCVPGDGNSCSSTSWGQCGMPSCRPQ